MRSVTDNMAISQAALSVKPVGTDLLKEQLIREIGSLEAQLHRLYARNDMIDYATIETYEDMIDSRKRTLDSLLWE